MVVVIDRSSQEPVYAQIAGQIRGLIAAGELAPGTRLPSVRALGSDLGVNLNTVARAYRQLEDEQFIALRGRRGAEVSARASAPSAGSVKRLKRDLGDLLARMRQAGFSRRALLELVGAELDAIEAVARERGRRVQGRV